MLREFTRGTILAAEHTSRSHSYHYVLEVAVGLEPADASAELLRQRKAVERWGLGDRRAEQRNLLRCEFAPAKSALDLAGYPGAARARLRPAFIDDGSHGDRSSGARPPLFAQAVTHSPSQRRTSIRS